MRYLALLLLLTGCADVVVLPRVGTKTFVTEDGDTLVYRMFWEGDFTMQTETYPDGRKLTRIVPESQLGVESAQAAARGATITARRKLGRNDPCPCGSGKKFKHCCLGRTGVVRVEP